MCSCFNFGRRYTRRLFHSDPSGYRPGSPRRRHRFAGLVFRLVFGAFIPFAVQAHGDKLQAVTAMAKAGARQLALVRIDRLQPDPRRDPDGWTSWERERFHILRTDKNWAAIAAQAQKLPGGLPVDFVRWAKTQAAAADLQLGDGHGARRLLRALIWSPDGDSISDPKLFARWRRMLIRSYLLDDDTQDAHIALLRYHQDYGVQAGEERLAARVALQSGHSVDAARLLARLPGAQDHALGLLAALRGATLSAHTVYERSVRLAATAAKSSRAQADFWAVAAAAAKAGKDRQRRIGALEHSLAVEPRGPRTSLLTVTADELWDAYLNYGRDIGNRRQFLIGQDDQWYVAATAARKTNPVQARALYAVLAFTGRSPARRRLAQARLASLIVELPDGNRLLARLYLRSKRFPTLASVPLSVRYRLLDYALRRSDLVLASRLMAGLERPPAGIDSFDWQLRRARVLIRAGQTPAGVAVLAKVLDQHPGLDGAALDRFVQVIFDLQTMHNNWDAIGLLNQLLTRKLPVQRRRELLFWRGDSYDALHRYTEAGASYLESAILQNPLAMDPWAQAARYHAAAALAKGGLTADARRLYQGLLSATRDRTRRRVLRHQIGQLLDAPRLSAAQAGARGGCQ